MLRFPYRRLRERHQGDIPLLLMSAAVIGKEVPDRSTTLTSRNPCRSIPTPSLHLASHEDPAHHPSVDPPTLCQTRDIVYMLPSNNDYIFCIRNAGPYLKPRRLWAFGKTRMIWVANDSGEFHERFNTCRVWGGRERCACRYCPYTRPSASALGFRGFPIASHGWPEWRSLRPGCR